jgi:menaquinone-dependent protoporphyrinogen oxidase
MTHLCLESWVRESSRHLCLLTAITMSILVAYATSTGSTVSVAERIAERLKPLATKVECLSVGDVSADTVSNSDAIIVGSGVQYYHWLKGAQKFVTQHAAVLQTKSVWAFSLGFPADEAELAQQEQLLGDKIREEVPDLKGHKFFWGRWRKRDAGIFNRVFLSIVAPQYVKRWGDDRNWEEIDAWAKTVGEKVEEGFQENAS